MEYCCKQTQLVGGVWTNCLVGGCNRLGDTVPESDWFVQFDHCYKMISGSEVESHVQCGSE